MPAAKPAIDSTTSRASPVSGSGGAGVAALVSVAVANIVLWVVARPAGQPAGRFVGELCGAEAVLLFSCALVLATLLRPIERAFGGLDRVALWHRRAAVTGVVLLIPHVALVGSAPDRYATSFGHALGDVALVGLLVLAVWALAPSLRAARWPGVIRRMARSDLRAVADRASPDGTIRHRGGRPRSDRRSGSAPLAGPPRGVPRRRHGRHRRVRVPGVARAVLRTDLRLHRGERPAAQPDDARRDPHPGAQVGVVRAGQFVFLALGGAGGWERHPFSVSSSPSDPQLELTIKASGDYTRELYEQLRTGVPAKLAGPFGGFDYRQGGRDQIWIAGGIGVTPFLSWIRSIDGEFDRRVDFYYSVAHAQDALYLDEIRAVTKQHPSLRLRLVCADTDGQLTPEEVVHSVSPEARPWVFMCGPPPMMKAFSAGLRKLGIPSRRVRWEQFGVR